MRSTFLILQSLIMQHTIHVPSYVGISPATCLLPFSLDTTDFRKADLTTRKCLYYWDISLMNFSNSFKFISGQNQIFIETDFDLKKCTIWKLVFVLSAKSIHTYKRNITRLDAKLQSKSTLVNHQLTTHTVIFNKILSTFYREYAFEDIVYGSTATLVSGDELKHFRVLHSDCLVGIGLSVGYGRDDSTFAPTQWETALLCNDVSQWLGASLESALYEAWRPNSWWLV